ncbi:unnamed protein product [Prunus armeniaca]
MVAVVRLGGVGGLAGYVVAGDDGDGLIGYVVAGYGFDGDAEKWFGTFPRNLVIMFPSGTGVVPAEGSPMLNFDVGLWTSVVGLPRVEGGEVALMLRSVGLVLKVDAEGTHGPGVPQVLLREFSEGDLELSSEGNVALPFGSPVGGRGSTLAHPALFVQRLMLAKSEGRVEWTGEGTSERFDFRASHAVSSP